MESDEIVYAKLKDAPEEVRRISPRVSLAQAGMIAEWAAGAAESARCTDRQALEAAVNQFYRSFEVRDGGWWEREAEPVTTTTARAEVSIGEILAGKGGGDTRPEQPAKEVGRRVKADKAKEIKGIVADLETRLADLKKWLKWAEYMDGDTVTAPDIYGEPVTGEAEQEEAEAMPYKSMDEVPVALKGIKPPVDLEQANLIAGWADEIEKEGEVESPWGVAIAQFKKAFKVESGKWVKKAEEQEPAPGGPEKCVCPECDYEAEKIRGVPCRSMKCPECGAELVAGTEDDEGLTEMFGSVLNPYGKRSSKGYPGGRSAWKKAWRAMLSQGDTGTIQGTIRRASMIAAGMKPKCNLPTMSSEDMSPRSGPCGKLEGSWKHTPGDYNLSHWKNPSNDNLTQEDIQLTCQDLEDIKRMCLQEIAKRHACAKKESKEAYDSLQDFINNVQVALRDHFCPEETPNNTWVTNQLSDDLMWNNAVMTEIDGKRVSIGYRETGSGFTFADRSDWQEVVMTYSGTDTGKVEQPQDEEVNEDMNEQEQETAEEGQEQEETELCESVAGAVSLEEAEAAAGDPMVMHVRLIRPGWGNKRDNHYYPADVLERDAHVFVGAKMFETDHKASETNNRTWVSTVTDIVKFDDGPIAEVVAHDPSFIQRTRNLKAANLLDKLECSIRATGRTKPYAEGERKGQAVEAIVDKRSVDWVTKAGAGGKAINIMEGEPGQEPEPEPEPGPTYLAKEIVAELLEASKMPKLAQGRLAEANYLDEEAVRAAVKREREYLQEITGAGRPVGVGKTEPPKVDLEEIEKRKNEVTLKWLH